MTEKLFGPYRLEMLIGRGGMGRAVPGSTPSRSGPWRSNGCPTRSAPTPSSRLGSVWASELAARLSEPHIIPIHDYGEIDGQLYIEGNGKAPAKQTALRALDRRHAATDQRQLLFGKV